jgi:hypothetical protein
MPAYCAAYGCNNLNTRVCNKKFYRFPRDPERRRAWTNALKIKGFQATDHIRLCSDHFVTGKC